MNRISTILLFACVFICSSCIKDPEFSLVSSEPNNTTNLTTAAWVDLGLPSGLLWYYANLGATTPEGFGNYYAWGEVQPKSEYSFDTYTYGDLDLERITYTLYKYNSSVDYGTVDNKTILESADDAASAMFGTGARIPTKTEWQELLDNTEVEWTTVNNVKGRKFTAANGNSLFLPAAGYQCGSELYDADKRGHYWSSSLDENFPTFAWRIGFGSDYQRVLSDGREVGFSVRAVRSAK